MKQIPNSTSGFDIFRCFLLLFIFMLFIWGGQHLQKSPETDQPAIQQYAETSGMYTM